MLKKFIILSGASLMLTTSSFASCIYSTVAQAQVEEAKAEGKTDSEIIHMVSNPNMTGKGGQQIADLQEQIRLLQMQLAEQGGNVHEVHVSKKIQAVRHEVIGILDSFGPSNKFVDNKASFEAKMKEQLAKFYASCKKESDARYLLDQIEKHKTSCADMPEGLQAHAELDLLLGVSSNKHIKKILKEKEVTLRNENRTRILALMEPEYNAFLADYNDERILNEGLHPILRFIFYPQTHDELANNVKIFEDTAKSIKNFQRSHFLALLYFLAKPIDRGDIFDGDEGVNLKKIDYLMINMFAKVKLGADPDGNDKIEFCEKLRPDQYDCNRADVKSAASCIQAFIENKTFDWEGLREKCLEYKNEFDSEIVDLDTKVENTPLLYLIAENLDKCFGGTSNDHKNALTAQNILDTLSVGQIKAILYHFANEHDKFSAIPLLIRNILKPLSIRLQERETMGVFDGARNVGAKHAITNIITQMNGGKLPLPFGVAIDDGPSIDYSAVIAPLRAQEDYCDAFEGLNYGKLSGSQPLINLIKQRKRNPDKELLTYKIKLNWNEFTDEHFDDLMEHEKLLFDKCYKSILKAVFYSATESQEFFDANKALQNFVQTILNKIANAPDEPETIPPADPRAVFTLLKANGCVNATRKSLFLEEEEV